MKTIYTLLLSICTFIMPTASLKAQEAAPVSEFKIVITTTQKGIDMTCNKGCAWKELSFTRSNYKPQAINAFGMTSITKKQAEDKNLANFLFVIEKTDEGFSLDGIKGTAWTELSFTNTHQAINQMGITSF